MRRVKREGGRITACLDGGTGIRVGLKNLWGQLHVGPTPTPGTDYKYETDMSAVDVNKLKVGVTFEEGGELFKVMKYDFSKIGRGSANIKVKAKNLLTGSIVTKSYLSGNRVEQVALEKKEMQYLYSDGVKVYFMDPRTYEQLEIGREVLGDDLKYLVEGENAWMQFWDEKIIGVEVPPSVVLMIAETEPWVKGNSATNIYKPATTFSGLTVQVPLFVKEGDRIKVNTTTGEYTMRVNE